MIIYDVLIKLLNCYNIDIVAKYISLYASCGGAVVISPIQGQSLRTCNMYACHLFTITVLYAEIVDVVASLQSTQEIDDNVGNSYCCV